MICLRYHEGDWRYVAGELVMRAERIPLCTERKPLPNASPLRRLEQGIWQLAPVVYRAGSFWRVPREFFLLIGAPPEENERMAIELMVYD